MLVVRNPPANAADIRDVGLIPESWISPGGGHGNPLQYSCLDSPMDRGAWWTTVHRVTKSRTWLKWLSMHEYINIYYMWYILYIFQPIWNKKSLKKWMNPCLTAKEKIEWGGSGLLIMNSLTFLYLTKCCIQRRRWHPTPVLLPGKSHGQRSLVGCSQSVGSLRVRHDWATSLFTFHFHALEKEVATHSSVLARRISGTGEPGGLPSMGSPRFGQDWSDLAAAAAAANAALT